MCIRERDGRRSVGIAICRDSIWMAIARYYSQKSGVWRSMEDPEPCKSSSSSSSSSSFSFEAFSRPLSRLLSDAQETGNRELSMAKAV